jgi:hypothetical protein
LLRNREFIEVLKDAEVRVPDIVQTYEIPGWVVYKFRRELGVGKPPRSYDIPKEVREALARPTELPTVPKYTATLRRLREQYQAVSKLVNDAQSQIKELDATIGFLEKQSPNEPDPDAILAFIKKKLEN